MKKAVILFNLGGPDKLENVEPFLFNLFFDPAILNLPILLRFPLAKFIANRRLTQLGLDEEFTGVTNPFPWMSEIIDLRKEKNFFETRVTEYQVGGALNWE